LLGCAPFGQAWLPWRFFIFFSYLKTLLSLRIVTDAELMIAAYRA
jgi:hypothetical protein